jgi:hypothetical protein
VADALTARLFAALSAVARHLDEAGSRWALIGGLAVSARAEPRLTRDIDLAVDVADDEGAERLAFNLGRHGYRVVTSLEQEAVARLATIRLAPPAASGEGIVVDLLFCSSGIEREVVDAAARLELVPGLVVPVASEGHLVALKLLSEADRRPQDAIDLVALLRDISDQELSRAREAIALIEHRGTHRQKDLPASLEAWMRRVAN